MLQTSNLSYFNPLDEVADENLLVLFLFFNVADENVY